MSLFPLKPTHAPVKAYYAALAEFLQHGHTTEGNTRSAFADLLKRCAKPYGWLLVESLPFKGTAKQPLVADGAIEDGLGIVQGLWEAKDNDDNLKEEIKVKVAKGYPLTNILFQTPSHAVLYQNNIVVFDDSIATPEKLVELLKLFFDYTHPDIPDWKDAVEQFSGKIAELAEKTTAILLSEQGKNPDFRARFESFSELCRQSINPDLTDDAVRKMLVQHLLTERIFRKIFNNQEFLSRNVIAVEIEKVIKSITDRHFSRDTFLKSLDRYYKAIEKAAEANENYGDKQTFLNAVYEKFFQRFDAKQADTHGIVYTAQPIVDFMVRSVEEILHQEFGKSLSDSGVHILDPFTGTGTFITRIMQQIKRSALPQKYAEELHCNEIMLLPYYIASMNIEHAYMDSVGQYSPFEGICLVDTFDLAEDKQRSLFTTENTARVLRQKRAPIRVVIGNPPYNSGQTNENDNNKNRKYPVIDQRVRALYAAGSNASLLTSLSDPYVKAFRWASDRIEKEGIVAFVSNSSFIDQVAFDQMRKRLGLEFDHIYVYDLGGNVRKNPRLSGTTHNVFGIQVGVSITFLVRTRQFGSKPTTISYFASRPNAKRAEKYRELGQTKSIATVKWSTLTPDNRNNWLTGDMQQDFADMLSLGQKEREPGENGQTIFNLFSHGINTSRDATLYGFHAAAVKLKVTEFSEAYNSEVSRWIRIGRPSDVDGFVDYEKLKWSRNLKRQLASGNTEEFEALKACLSLYRPFTTSYLYQSEIFVDESGRMANIFPPSPSGNTCICVTSVGSEKPFLALAAAQIPNYHLAGAGSGTQCFPIYVYDSASSNRRENISSIALSKFRTHYADDTITKWDIFHATYAVLHHPEYRTRYAANLKRELPRIPFPPDFHAFAAAGKRLMELHIDYEKQPEYPLEQIEHAKAEVSFRVERMKLSKDKTELRYNDFLTLRGIPAAAFDYRLGNRSALEWVIDQYRVSTDARSGIVNDPNREDDPQYILRLIGQVITVSLETQQIVAAFPSLKLGELSA